MCHEYQKIEDTIFIRQAKQILDLYKMKLKKWSSHQTLQTTRNLPCTKDKNESLFGNTSLASASTNHNTTSNPLNEQYAILFLPLKAVLGVNKLNLRSDLWTSSICSHYAPKKFRSCPGKVEDLEILNYVNFLSRTWLFWTLVFVSSINF